MTDENQTDNANVLRLKVMLPSKVLVDETVVKVTAPAVNGEFCLLPRHIDFVAALVPGILSFWINQKVESYVALDEGVLVKCGRDVSVSTLNGVRGTDLNQLQRLLEERIVTLDEQERKARTALARLEAGTLRRFRNLQEKFHG